MFEMAQEELRYVCPSIDKTNSTIKMIPDTAFKIIRMSAYIKYFYYVVSLPLYMYITSNLFHELVTLEIINFTCMHSNSEKKYVKKNYNKFVFFLKHIRYLVIPQNKEKIKKNCCQKL
jgi:hypothetical protein